MKCYFKILFFFILLNSTSIVSQNTLLKKLEKKVIEKKIIEANLIKDSINIQNLKTSELAKYNYLNARLNQLDNKSNLAFDNYIISKKLYKTIDSLDKVNLINIEIVSLLLSLDKNKVDYKPYLKEFNAYAKEKKNPIYLSKLYKELGKSFYDSLPNTSLTYFKKALQENLKTKDEKLTGILYQNIGATYASDKIKKFDSALFVYDKALSIFKKHNEFDLVFNIYTNKGVTYSKKREYNKSIFYFLKADSIITKEYSKKNKEILYGYVAKMYKNSGDFKKSIEYLEKQKVYADSILEDEQNIAIADIQTKYETKEKEIQILSLEKEKIMNYSIIGLLIIIITTSILAYKNLSKKKKIIEQEKQLETEKLKTTLKEQELHEIDVMLESQEKERQIIANELHDNLGSMLATLKLNFENLKRYDTDLNDKENQLFEKTDALIEEAYQKVRNISHLKNLGVIGSEGLVIAVKKMAEKMSVLEKLQINVIPHGLNERLENKLEVLLFRMIQELCTNIIKHSEATEVNIYLTQHNSSELNIIIEDNGKGFDPKSIVETSGIGLKSIEKKVEQMNGTFTIDSILSKGTTIIIDLPI